MTRRGWQRVTAAAWAIALSGTSLVMDRTPAAAVASPCSEPGKDGTGSFAGGYPNSYYPGSGSPAAGATTLTVGTIAPAPASQTALSAGDLILIYQTQGATFTTTNTSAYGAGTTTGAGITGTPTAGTYEFARVVSFSGSTITLVGGTGGGTINAYTSAAATTTTGVKDWQVVRVPQYGNYTNTGSAYTAPWNGATGGIIALDVAGTLTASSGINADGYGFRGGGQNPWGNGYGGTAATTTTQATPDGATDGDYAYAVGSGNTNITTAISYSTYNGGPDGFKGEGIAGTPIWTYTSGASAPAFSPSSATYTNDGVSAGYPGGSKSKGAPGNAGGGAMDGDANGYGPVGFNPVSTSSFNQYNAGGGGGANAGAGGLGGRNWAGVQNNTTDGSALTQGIGGAAIAGSVATRLYLGGGGGAGSNNDGSKGSRVIAAGGGTTFTPTVTTASSGASGGGLVMLRVGTMPSGTVSSQGIAGPDPDNDGGGGGGGGGTVVITAPTTGTVTATVNVAGGAGASSTGGNGGTTGYGGAGTYEHGTGGGGGGGAVFNSGTGVTATLTGGVPGDTAAQSGISTAANYYATSGGTGTQTNSVAATAIVGVRSGAECSLLLLAKRYTAYTPFGGGTTTYTGYTADGYTDPASNIVVDADPVWPQASSVIQILGNLTQPAAPKDSVEYTIYMLSAGGKTDSSVGVCDFVPANQTLNATAYNAGASAVKVTVGYASPTVSYLGTTPSSGASGVYPINTATGAGSLYALPAACGTAPKDPVTNLYSAAAIYYNPTTMASFVTSDTGYAKMAFTAKIN